jgi:hypothetical protein
LQENGDACRKTAKLFFVCATQKRVSRQWFRDPKTCFAAVVLRLEMFVNYGLTP